ncbi:unnamed protein product [Spirodela intermedia]|uniref:Uncharacterized protein n=1 Tax=Spirodela intermedia TaxID=51605 RepID=A0A7I8I927_SPIIN|nr:unnamed protein product [Spirodela intermedia]CAA6654186.1 unnamed protein product [Spirodela intermedia]
MVWFLCRLLRRSGAKLPTGSGAHLPLLRLDVSLCSFPVFPPRKARQATRRLLKLLSSRRQELAGALETLESDPISLYSSHAAALVSAVADPLISFDLYRFLRSAGGGGGGPPSDPPSLLCSLLGSQLRSRSPRPFRLRFYLGEMKKHEAHPSYEEFRALTSCLNPSLAGSFFEEVIETLGPDSTTFAAAISFYVENGLVEEALGLAERARKEVEGPHCVEFYTSLMGLHRIRRDPKAAMEAFLEMEEGAEVAAGEGTYWVLLEILCVAGWAKLCWAILQRMKERGGFNSPSESSGLILMRAFLQRDMVREAEWLFREGVLREKESCAVFAELMSEKKMPLAALELLRTTPHLISCAEFLIKGCGKAGLVEDAETIFREFGFSENEPVRRRLPLLSSMVFVYSRAARRSSAERAWSQLEASGGLAAEPCLWMMSMYGEMGLFDSVEKMFDQWKNSGVPLNEDGYGALVNAYTRAGKLIKARGCLSEMRKSGLRPPPAICYQISEGFLRAGLLTQAAVVANELRVSGSWVDDGRA